MKDYDPETMTQEHKERLASVNPDAWFLMERIFDGKESVYGFIRDIGWINRSKMHTLAAVFFCLRLIQNASDTEYARERVKEYMRNIFLLPPKQRGSWIAEFIEGHPVHVYSQERIEIHPKAGVVGVKSFAGTYKWFKMDKDRIDSVDIRIVQHILWGYLMASYQPSGFDDAIAYLRAMINANARAESIHIYCKMQIFDHGHSLLNYAKSYGLQVEEDEG